MWGYADAVRSFPCMCIPNGRYHRFWLHVTVCTKAREYANSVHRFSYDPAQVEMLTCMVCHSSTSYEATNWSRYNLCREQEPVHLPPPPLRSTLLPESLLRPSHYCTKPCALVEQRPCRLLLPFCLSKCYLKPVDSTTCQIRIHQELIWYTHQLGGLILVSLQETRSVFNGYVSVKVDVLPSVLQKGSHSRSQILLVFLWMIFVSAIDVHKDCCNVNDVSDPKARRKG